MSAKGNRARLFSEFPPVSTPEWEEKIKADLKGADYGKKLIWKTDEGFDVRPYYRSEDLKELDYLDSLPGEAPFTRGVKKENNRWIVRQDIMIPDVDEANRIALNAISRGANAIGFNVKEISAHKQMSRLLKDIDLSTTGINFIASRSYPLTLELFIYEISHRNLDGKNIQGSINFDSTGYLLLHGDFYASRESNIDEAEYLVSTIHKKLPNFRAITINGQIFCNSGATTVQELAFSLASANDYLCHLSEKDIPVDTIASKLLFSFGTGSDFFLEIAKLRAARLLWANILNQYKPGSEESMKMFIHAYTSRSNKTIYDPYVNMLRTTTEGMSAVLGNADSLTILPFDTTYKEEDEFSARIARNQQLIMREEAYLDQIVDPAGGAYYIENLTHSIASHAWEKFRMIEEKGGFTECIKAGIIQDEIEETCKKKEADVISRKKVFIGTNQYPNLLEKMPDISASSVATEKKEPAKYKTLRLFRPSGVFESLRMATENYVKTGNKKPSVFLLQVGNLAMRKARAAFSTNFFGCAGYEIIDRSDYKGIEDGVKMALEASPSIIVLCSSDEEYAEIVTPVTAIIKKQNPSIQVVVAGYPKELIESMKAAGVDDFIHIRSNVAETLKKFHSHFGIA